MSTRSIRIQNAFDTVCEIYDELNRSEKYYLKAHVEEYFRLKALYLQVTSGDIDRSSRPWRACNSEYLTYEAHLECEGMSSAQAMEEYLLLVLSNDYRNEVAFGGICYDNLVCDLVLKDLGLDDEEDD